MNHDDPRPAATRPDDSRTASPRTASPRPAGPRPAGTGPRPAGPSPRQKANRTFALHMILGAVFYVAGVFAAGFAASQGVSPWWAAILILPGIGLMALANIVMYRSGDEFQRARIGEAVLLAFVISAPLILAVGALQFTVLPEINWIFAFSILMLSWIVGTVISAIRYR